MPRGPGCSTIPGHPWRRPWKPGSFTDGSRSKRHAAGHAGGTGAHGGEQQPYGGGGGGLDFVTDDFDIAREL